MNAKQNSILLSAFSGRFVSVYANGTRVRLVTRLMYTRDRAMSVFVERRGKTRLLANVDKSFTRNKSKANTRIEAA